MTTSRDRAAVTRIRGRAGAALARAHSGAMLALLSSLLLLAACADDHPRPVAAATTRAAAAAAGTAPTGASASYAATSPWSVAESVTVDVPLALPAQLYVEHDAVVPARAAGTIDSLFVDLGAHVAGGALLATVESADQRIALDSAEAARDAAERLVQRARTLTQAGGMTGADSEAAEFGLRQASLALAKARRGLELTRVVAPFAGVVADRRARPRRLVAVGDTLFRVAESGPLLARVHVPEDAAVALRPGARATVTGVRGASAGAEVVRVAPAVDAASGTREMVLRVAPTGALLPGSGVTVRLGGQRRRVLALAREAVGADGYALVGDAASGRATLRLLTLGADLGGGRVEVLGGLAPGERVSRPMP